MLINSDITKKHVQWSHFIEAFFSLRTFYFPGRFSLNLLYVSAVMPLEFTIWNHVRE